MFLCVFFASEYLEYYAFNSIECVKVDIIREINHSIFMHTIFDYMNSKTDKNWKPLNDLFSINWAWCRHFCSRFIHTLIDLSSQQIFEHKYLSEM